MFRIVKVIARDYPRFPARYKIAHLEDDQKTVGKEVPGTFYAMKVRQDPIRLGNET